MLLQRKALYNLIQINISRIESGELKIADLQPWQIANYREKPPEELFQQLAHLGIALGKEDFEKFAERFECPEEIVEVLAQDREPLEKDELFLIFFELWRRFFPEKRTISIFCDELDYQMIAYDLGKPSAISETLIELQHLLDDHIDRGIAPQKAFQLIQMYCATDIEDFLFDYILGVIEIDNASYAMELLDGFTQYVKDPLWFEYLKARATIIEDPEDGYDALEKNIHKAYIHNRLDVIEEIVFFLASSGNHSLFNATAKKMFSLLRTEEDFQVFLEACYTHYDYLELKEPALAIAQLFHNRKSIPASSPLNPADPGLLEMHVLLDQKLHFAEE